MLKYNILSDINNSGSNLRYVNSISQIILLCTITQPFEDEACLLNVI
jgi:hypothetical protein